MKKTVALTFCMLLLVALVLSVFIMSLDDEAGSHDGGNGDSAFIIWGTLDYANETFMGGEPELNASRDVCEAIHSTVLDTQQFGYCKNFWGNDTQPDQVYGNVSYCEENYDFTAVFYKGHSIGGYCDVEDCEFGEHWTLYAAEGYGNEYIMDYLIHDRMSSGNHDFVFLWTCGYGAEDLKGDIDENGHSVGMMASWMDTTDLEADGYASPDGSNHCFIGFDVYSIFFINKTGYGSFDYGDFASLFFQYALIDGWTINDALDAAAEETHWQSSFGDCQLYTGYVMLDPYDPGQTVMCYMRVWGDGNLKLGGDVVRK
jgi:hypothetical protein